MKLFRALLPDGGPMPQNLANIHRTGMANDALYADGLTINIDGPARRTALSLDEVRKALRDFAMDQGIEIRVDTPESLFIIWRSPTLGFPNSAQAFFEADNEGTRVHFYGRALYGMYDFGANRTFINRWAEVLLP